MNEWEHIRHSCYLHHGYDADNADPTFPAAIGIQF